VAKRTGFVNTRGESYQALKGAILCKKKHQRSKHGVPETSGVSQKRKVGLHVDESTTENCWSIGNREDLVVKSVSKRPRRVHFETGGHYEKRPFSNVEKIRTHRVNFIVKIH